MQLYFLITILLHATAEATVIYIVRSPYQYSFCRWPLESSRCDIDTRSFQTCWSIRVHSHRCSPSTRQRLHTASEFQTSFIRPISTHVDGCCVGGFAAMFVCLFVCLFFRTISQNRCSCRIMSQVQSPCTTSGLKTDRSYSPGVSTVKVT